MFEKCFYVEGLAHASYLIGADGEAAVIDPKRDVENYLQAAEEGKLRIVAVLETHPHADFVSGHVELARRTGARIYVSHLAPARYERVAARDGDTIAIGPLEILVLETPGHSPDSLSFVVRQQGKAVRVYTGDTLFAGDVGRPDLRGAEEKPTRLAGALYDSLFGKLLQLPEDVKVFPAHGAGSLCGRKISSAPFTTIGQERLSNWALQLNDRDQFVRTMVENLPDRPQYFSYDVATNLAGAPLLSSLPGLRPLTEAEVKTAAAGGASVIDTRSAPFFGTGHFPGSLSIGLSSSLFATWTGFFVPAGKPIVLVAGSADSARKARLELARIGYDHVLGYLEADELTHVQQLSQLGVEELHAALRRGEAPHLLDVRTAGEWETEHIEGASHIPLPGLPRRAGELNKDAPLAVICGSGYRSSLAASLLQARGFTRVQNVMGGMGAYLESRLPDWQPSDLVFIGENI
ncbi:MAG TPA: MBL fold metallo-hydrolase [Candidatus Binatia bacterium]|jgi:hydroxyacylglutathione hydrolase|nr:MBL fold metallo-hydrolase [Candidatus Binatia bacterium]